MPDMKQSLSMLYPVRPPNAAEIQQRVGRILAAAGIKPGDAQAGYFVALDYATQECADILRQIIMASQEIEQSGEDARNLLLAAKEEAEATRKKVDSIKTSMDKAFVKAEESTERKRSDMIKMAQGAGIGAAVAAVVVCAALHFGKLSITPDMTVELEKQTAVIVEAVKKFYN